MGKIKTNYTSINQDSIAGGEVCTQLRLVRPDQLIQKFGVGKTHFWTKLVARPDFPKSITLGRARLWKEHEIDEWILAQFVFQNQTVTNK